MDWNDVSRIAETHDEVMEALNAGKPNAAAELLCKRLKWLVHENESFWAGLRKASESVAELRCKQQEVLDNLPQLLDDELNILNNMRVPPEKTELIFDRVYGAIELVSLRSDRFDPTQAALKNLQDRLGVAAKLICDAYPSAMERAVASLVSWRGARILAGAAVAGGNAVAALTLDGGTLSWVSIKVGIRVMRDDVDGIIDILGGKE